MSVPWELTIWVVCQEGRPFDYRFSRAAAFGRASILRAAAPSGTWSVSKCRAHLVVLEQNAADEEGDGAVANASERVATPLPAPDAGWRDMESAPKDGFFHVWLPALAEQGFIGIVDAYWDAEHGRVEACRDDDLLDAYEATHWRPLPAPPVGDGSAPAEDSGPV